MDRITRIVFLIALFATFGMADVGNTNAAPSMEGREFIVLVGEEEGQEMLLHCLNGEVEFWVMVTPIGGGLSGVPDMKIPCRENSLRREFPGSTIMTFDDPTEGWHLERGSEEGQVDALRCATFSGTLITVNHTPSGWPSIKTELNSPECNPAT